MKSRVAKMKKHLRVRRHRRVRAKVNGTAVRPRVSVFRSLRGMVGQLIDDATGRTLVAVNTKEVKQGDKALSGERTGKIALAYLAGKLLAEKAQTKGIKQVVFDRGGYQYHGRVAALADGCRDGGLSF